jgi:predicted Zn-dependent protease
VDVAALGVVIVALALPAPEFVVEPLLRGEPSQLAAAAELEAECAARPDEAGPAVELADLYLDLGHPAWSLSLLLPLAERHVPNHQVYVTLAAAYAERRDMDHAAPMAAEAARICDQGRGCDAPTRARLEVFSSTLRAAAEQKLDYRRDPQKLREVIRKLTRPATFRR